MPGQQISKSDARKLIQYYRDNGGWAGNQTRSIWFAKENFIEMLWMMSKLEADGMDIYLAKYPNEDLPGTPDPNYKNRLTIVFIPTTDKQDIFDVQAPPDSDMQTSAQSSILAKDGDGDEEDPDDDDENGFNHGELRP